MADKILTEDQKFYYGMTIKGLVATSKEICKANGCTEDDHQCGSNAYFDYNKDTQMFYLVDVCISDYRTKCDDSYIPMPIPEDYTIEQLINDLENNLLEDENE